MPTQPAILGTARLNNFRLGYRPAALTAVRQSRATILIGGVLARVRKGSVVIRDVINDEPNTCSLTVSAQTPPADGQRLRITVNSDTPRLLFDGAIETVTESYDGKPAQVMYACTAQDDTPRANRRIPLGYWANISATQVGQELVGAFAPGFTTNHVQAGLPPITVHFEGSEAGMNGCLRQISKLIGGYFYWEARDLHLFTAEATDLPDPLDATPGRFLDDPHIRITWDDSQLRTRVYGKGHQEASQSDVAAGGTQIPIGDVSMYNTGGGKFISESQIGAYTGTVVGGQGALVGTTVTPTNAPTVTPSPSTGLAAGSYTWEVTFGTAAGETLPGPGTTTAIGGALPPPTTAPTPGAPTSGGSVTSGVHQYGITYTTASGETLPTALSGSVTTGGIASYVTPPQAPSATTDTGHTQSYWSIGHTVTVRTTYITASGETTGSGSSNTVTIIEIPPSTGSPCAISVTLTASSDPAVTGIRVYYTHSAGTGSGRESSSYANTSTTVSAPVAIVAGSPPGSNTAISTYANTVPLSAIQIGPTGTTGRKVYRTVAGGSQLKLLTTIANNTATTYTDTTADGSLGANAPTTATAVSGAADLSAIPIGPSGVTSRKLYRTPVGPATPYKLVTTIANNTATTYSDTTPDASLGAAAPSTDTSGLVAQSGDVPAGSTTMLVTSTGFAISGGGWAFIGALPIRYTGTSGNSITGIPSTGPGSLTTTVRYGSEVIAASMLTGVTGLVRPLIKGAPIHIWVQRDDTAAQALLVAREGEGDGIIEHRIVDERRGEASLIALCDADLAQFSRPLVTVTYATRDVKTKSGKPIVINIPSPAINQTLTIQDVTIDQIDIAPGLAPRFTVTASSVRYSLEDLLRRMASQLEGQ